MLIAGLSAYTIYQSITALLYSAGFATFMADQAAIDGQSIDQADFLLHWRATYATETFLAGVGLVAGIAMVLLKRWSWLLVAGTAIACILLSLLSVAAGYSRYGFEHVGLIQAVGFVLLVAVAIVAYRKCGRA